MQNIELVHGACAICGGSIDSKWAGENPALGTKCRRCSFKNPEPEVFGPDHVEIHVTKQVRFDPLFGRYEYDFDWKGSRIMVNGRVGTTTIPQGGGDYVQFEGDDPKRFGTFINGIGYWDLLRVYKAQGGDTTPPPLELPVYTPEKTTLLAEPIMPVRVEVDEKQGAIQSITVGEGRGVLVRLDQGPDPLVLPMLHALTNLYVRYKFGLMPNFVYEGGFIGRNFEVRNALSGPVMISVSGEGSFGEAYAEIRSREDWHRYDSVQQLLGAAYAREQSRPEVIYNDADVVTVLSVWALVMTTFLRYDWCQEQYQTIEDIWRCYCRMQDVLLNIMPIEELEATLAYARANEMVHFGRKY